MGKKSANIEFSARQCSGTYDFKVFAYMTLANFMIQSAIKDALQSLPAVVPLYIIIKFHE